MKCRVVYRPARSRKQYVLQRHFVLPVGLLTLTQCSIAWTAESRQLNIESPHTLKLSIFFESLAVQWPVNGDGETDRKVGGSMPVCRYKLQLHVSCDSRGQRIHLVYFFFFSCLSSLPLHSLAMTMLTVTSLQCCWNTALVSRVNSSTEWVTKLIQMTQCDIV